MNDMSNSPFNDPEVSEESSLSPSNTPSESNPLTEKPYRHYIVQDILPCYVPHIVVGSPGVGKSLLTEQLYGAITTGGSFLNYQAYKHTVRYVSTYAYVEKYYAQAKVLGIDLDDVLYIPKKDHTIYDILKECPDHEVLIIESIARLMPTMNVAYYREVSNFMNELESICLERKITIIGTHLASKRKGGQNRGLAQDIAMGSGAFAEAAGTTIVVERGNEDDIEDNSRRIHICAGTAASVVLDVEISHNLTFSLIELAGDTTKVRTSIKRKLASLPKGETFTVQDVMNWSDSSQSTAYRQICRAEQAKFITKVSPGLWARGETA